MRKINLIPKKILFSLLLLLVNLKITISSEFVDLEEEESSCSTSSHSLSHSSLCKMGPVVETRERSFIMVKPDGVQRGLVGEVIKRFEQKGFKLIAMKFQTVEEEQAKEHYKEHDGKPFFPKLVKFIGSGPVVPMVWEGLNVVSTGRTMIGKTNPADSAPGTLRGDFCVDSPRNLIHGSDSIESAAREIGIWFKKEELVEWKSNEESWLYE